MSADRTETRNLAGQQPDEVNELSARWEAWAARANVLPLGSWRSKPAGKKSGQ